MYSFPMALKLAFHSNMCWLFHKFTTTKYTQNYTNWFNTDVKKIPRYHDTIRFKENNKQNNTWMENSCSHLSTMDCRKGDKRYKIIWLEKGWERILCPELSLLDRGLLTFHAQTKGTTVWKSNPGSMWSARGKTSTHLSLLRIDFSFMANHLKTSFYTKR